MKKYYDKISHVTVSFFLLVWLSKLPIPALGCAFIVFTLCCFRTLDNFVKDENYRPAGDWIANIAGFGFWVLYLIL